MQVSESNFIGDQYHIKITKLSDRKRKVNSQVSDLKWDVLHVVKNR